MSHGRANCNVVKKEKTFSADVASCWTTQAETGIGKGEVLRILESGLMNASTHPGPQTVISLNACSD